MEQNHYLLTNLLSEEEERIITSITAHIEKGGKRPGIQQIANENYLSTTFIVKMCKRLGFDGYSELYYNYRGEYLWLKLNNVRRSQWHLHFPRIYAILFQSEVLKFRAGLRGKRGWSKITIF